ncbi:MAG: CPBP family intramembrane metalloprotease domain-containing protein [Kocuria rhizophila]|nr:MAG: CPBP family intramembrane metalloprotease domain-containing protein [Kocuria rhizophila]
MVFVLTDSQRPQPLEQRPARSELWFHIVLVLGVSLGSSAVYAVLNLAETLSRGPLSDAQATLNQVLSPVPAIDLLRQLASIGFALVPVALALYLMAGSLPRIKGVLRRIGMDGRRPVRDALWGLGLFLVMGLGTLGLYQAGRELGLTAAINTSALDEHWWTVPVLILSALRHSLVEEIIVVAFLCDRLRRIGWSWVTIAVLTSVFRASYHLYQGFGPALGNLVMGLVFVWVYRRYGRLAPLLIAHALLDITGFLLPQLLAG